MSWTVEATNRIPNVEEDCKRCIKNYTNVFIKRLWFPLAPADYICMNLNTKMTKYNIIVEAICDLNMCKGIDLRHPKFIIDPSKKLCSNDSVNYTIVDTNTVPNGGESEGDLKSTWPQTLKLCVHIGEGLFVLFVIVSYLIKSRQQVTDTVISVYHRIINLFQLKTIN